MTTTGRTETRLTRILGKAYAPFKAVLKPVLGRVPWLNRLCVEAKERAKELLRARSVLPPLKAELRTRAGSDMTHLFLVRWIHRGGADLETLNYLRALSSQPGNRVTVIATFDGESGWASRVPDTVRFVEFGAAMRGLSWRERQRVLFGFLDEVRPPVVHNVNSELAFRVFCKHGSRLARHSGLYVSVFCTDLDLEGARGGYGHYLATCYRYLAGVFCDNQRHLDELVEHYGLEPNKMHVHYQPAPEMPDIDVAAARASESGPLSVLWAGRWDRQKRPDVLARIAKACRDLPIRFHVYGAPVLDDETYGDVLRDIENVEIHGSFDGFASLPLEEFDVLLLTSQWEGLPNILLEAICVGMPILTSSVGGIPELLKDGESALLVDPFDAIEEYVARLKLVSGDRKALARLAREAKVAVSLQHSWDSFRRELEAHADYCRPAVDPVRRTAL